MKLILMETTPAIRSIYDGISYTGTGTYVKKERDTLNMELLQVFNIIAMGVANVEDYDVSDDTLLYTYLAASKMMDHFDTDWLDQIKTYVKICMNGKSEQIYFNIINDMETAHTYDLIRNRDIVANVICELLNVKLNSDRIRGLKNIEVGTYGVDNESVLQLMNQLAATTVNHDAIIGSTQIENLTKDEMKSLARYIMQQKGQINFFSKSKMDAHYSNNHIQQLIPVAGGKIWVNESSIQYQPRFVRLIDFMTENNYIGELIHICDKQTLVKIYNVLPNNAIKKPTRLQMLQTFHDFIDKGGILCN